MGKRRILVFSALAALALMGVAPGANASQWHDGRDPIATGCTSGAYLVTAWPMVNQKYNQVQGRVELMYSPVCQTNWVNIYGNVPGNEYRASISRGTIPGSGAKHAAVKNVGSDYSLMVYAPGSTCVSVGSNIFDLATGAVEMNDRRTFC